MQNSETETTPEHLPSCHLRCVAECGVSPRRAHLDAGPRVRTFHGAAVPPLERAPAPLWEHVDDFEAVRRSGCDIPLPEAYTAHERVDERYNLDRWTRPGGIADRALDAIHAALEDARKSKVKQTRDVAEVAALVRPVLHAPTKRAPAVRKRPATRRARELLALVIGEAPASPAPVTPWDTMHAVTAPIRAIHTALVWGLALLLFGREKDTVSEYAFGRLLPGEPVRDVRPPFAGAAHALAVADHDLPGLGGGSCPWPQDDPRMARRTFAKAGEMKVGASFHGTDRIRGEVAVNRVLDARAVARRAALEPHERAAVEVLSDRSLTRDEKAAKLREVEVIRRGIAPASLVTAETARLAALHAALTGAPRELYAQKLTARAEVDAAARAALLRVATADVSDGELYRRARIAEQRVRAAVERPSLAGDALAPKRPPKAPAVRPSRQRPERVLPMLGCA